MIFLSTHWTGSYDVFNDLVQPLLDPVHDTTAHVGRRKDHEPSPGNGVIHGLHSMFTSLVNTVMLSYVSDETIQRKIK
jgi:hypothetical protein